MKTKLDKIELQREREKLDKLVDEALSNGTPISKTYEIMQQSRKVNELMIELEVECHSELSEESLKGIE